MDNIDHISLAGAEFYFEKTDNPFIISVRIEWPTGTYKGSIPVGTDKRSYALGYWQSLVKDIWEDI